MRRLLPLLSLLLAALPALLLSAVPAGAVTIEPVTSPGGITAWLVEDHSNPIIDMEIAIRGGTSVEGAKPGLATLSAGLLDEGAGPLDSQAFQGKLEDLAIELNFEADRDNFRGHLKTVTEHSDTAFDMFRLALTQPRFDKEPVARVRAQILAMLARQQQSPDAVAALTFFKAAFPDHPYGVPVLGTPDSIKAIAVADLRGYVGHHLGRDNLVVAVTGDITPDRLGKLLDATFGALPAKSDPITVPDITPKNAGTVQVIPRDNPQSTAMFGEAGIKRDDPDWYSAYVMNYMLGGGGFESWLTNEVREKRGLAYNVYSALEPFRHAGLVMGGVATQNARFGESVGLIKQQWSRMREQGPSEQELADAKTFLIGSFPLNLDSTTNIASLLVTIQLENLGIDYLDRRAQLIGRVTMDDIHHVAQRLLDPNALAFVIVGKPEGVEATTK